MNLAISFRTLSERAAASSVFQRRSSLLLDLWGLVTRVARGLGYASERVEVIEPADDDSVKLKPSSLLVLQLQKSFNNAVEFSRFYRPSIDINSRSGIIDYGMRT